MAEERTEEMVVEIEEQSEEVTEQEDLDDTTETKSAASGLSSLDDVMSEGTSEAERDPRPKRVCTPTPSSDGHDPSTPSTPRSCSTTPPLRSSRVAAATTSMAKAMKFPYRQSINWIVGSRIEAKDFMNKWYPARIHEIDDDEQSVLIHFEGWNARYDEWIKMTSERLRPATRHSVRKESSKPRPGFKPSSSGVLGVGPPLKRVKIGKWLPQEHRVGECVFAKWTDCRLYAARIISINTNGSYDVLFYDGYRKTVQPINVKTMTAEVQKEYANLGLLPPPLKKGKCKGQGQEEVKEKERSREEKPRDRGRDRERQQSVPDRSPSTDSAEESKPYLEEYKKISPSSTGSGGIKRKRSSGWTFSKKSRTDSARSSLDSRESLDGKEEILNSPPKLEVTMEMPPSAKAPPLPQEAGGTFATQSSSWSASETLAAQTPASDSIVQEMGGLASPQEQPKPNPGPVPSVSLAPSVLTPDSKSPVLPCTPSSTVSNLEQYSPVGNASGGLPIGEHNPVSRELALDHEGKLLEKVWAPKEFKITDDHNQFKCPWEHCGKGFRKITLLEYHMKYYHTDDGRPLPPPPPRKRKKTLSTCSTDSEISVGGRSTGSRPARRKRDSAASMSIGSLQDWPLDVNVSTVTGAGDDNLVSENVDGSLGVVSQDEGREGAEDTPIISSWTPSKDEVVNCICQLNEENGLMIQCDVCLCWQHASCMGLTEDSLPKKYVCYICANPPGVRDSARYMCNQDWHRDGTLTTFNFLPASTSDNSEMMLATHHLIGDAHNVHYCLNALRQKLSALKDKSHPELQFWQKNWDREMERQRERSSLQPQPCTSHQTLNHFSVSGVEVMQVKDTGVMHVKDTEVKDEPIDVESRDDPMVSFYLGDSDVEVKSEIQSESVAQSTETEVRVDELKSEAVVCNNKTLDSKATALEQKACNPDESEKTSTPTVDTDQGSLPMASSTLSDIPQMSSQSAPSPVAGPSSAADLKISTSATELHDYSLVQRKDMEGITPGKRTSGFDSTEELESDVSVVTQEEDPFANCEKNLLEHIMTSQDRIEARLDAVEEQVAVLEALEDDPNLTSGDILGDIPALRRNIHQLLLDLNKVKRMARYH